MLIIPLSNGTKLDGSLNLMNGTLVIKQIPDAPVGGQTADTRLITNNTLTIPLKDIKGLVSSIKTLFKFL